MTELHKAEWNAHGPARVPQNAPQARYWPPLMLSVEPVM